MSEETQQQRDIKGKIASTAVASILHSVRDRKLTGRGHFTSGEDKVDMVFLNGEIIHAVSNDPDLRMGEILLHDGNIHLRDYLNSVQAMLDTGKRQGEFFVEEEILGDEDLKQAVRTQMREVIYWLLTWHSGDYLFRWGTSMAEGILLETSVTELILRGMSRIDRFSELREILAPWDRPVALNREFDLGEARKVKLKDDETAVLSQVNGSRTIREVIDLAPVDDHRAMQILTGLQWARLVAFVEQDQDFEDFDFTRD